MFKTVIGLLINCKLNSKMAKYGFFWGRSKVSVLLVNFTNCNYCIFSNCKSATVPSHTSQSWISNVAWVLKQCFVERGCWKVPSKARKKQHERSGYVVWWCIVLPLVHCSFPSLSMSQATTLVWLGSEPLLNDPSLILLKLSLLTNAAPGKNEKYMQWGFSANTWRAINAWWCMRYDNFRLRAAFYISRQGRPWIWRRTAEDAWITYWFTRVIK